MSLHTETLRVRVKDKHANVLSGMAFEVNQVWNAANEITRDYSWVPIPGVGYFNCGTSEFDLNKELKGIHAERGLSIGAATVRSVIAQHAKSRRQFKRNQLQWRASSGSKCALGWIPFKAAGGSRPCACGQSIQIGGHPYESSLNLIAASMVKLKLLI